jgi:hypothetical protein
MGDRRRAVGERMRGDPLPRFKEMHPSVSSELFTFLERHDPAPGQITLVAHQQLHPRIDHSPGNTASTRHPELSLWSGT